jgi:hypothetical protein
VKTLYALFETDTDLEVKGIGLKFGPATIYTKRAGGNNRAFSATFEDKTRAMSSRLQLAALSDEQSDAILMEVFAESVVTGWDGVTDREGNPLEFNKENFIKLMKDLPTLWRALRVEAANHENFLRQQAKAEGTRVGNS